MDVILSLADKYVLDDAYAYLFPYPAQPASIPTLNSTLLASSYAHSTSYHPSVKPTSALPRDHILRQSASLFTVALLGAYALYFLFCSISYFCFFDRRLEHHPRFLKNQKWLEIKSSLIAAPVIDVITIPWFLGEVRGHSKLYENVSDYGWTYFFASIGLYLLFTDFFIYWIHRLEHHPRIYKYIHKPHHKWISELFRTSSVFRSAHASANAMGRARLPPPRRLRPVPPLPVSHIFKSRAQPMLIPASLSTPSRCTNTSTSACSSSSSSGRS